MEKDFFDFIVKDMSKDSVKRACYIVREYKRYESNGNLVAVLFQNNKDTVVEQWHCDGNCNRNHGVGDFCPGVIILQKNYVSIFLIHPIFNRYKKTTIIHSRFCLFDIILRQFLHTYH